MFGAKTEMICGFAAGRVPRLVVGAASGDTSQLAVAIGIPNIASHRAHLTLLYTMSVNGGGFNRSTQHLLILPDEEVCVWRGMHGHGSRRSRRLSSGSAGRAVNVWRTSPERLRGGTRAASIGSWLSMAELL